MMKDNQLQYDNNDALNDDGTTKAPPAEEISVGIMNTHDHDDSCSVITDMESVRYEMQNSMYPRAAEVSEMYSSNGSKEVARLALNLKELTTNSTTKEWQHQVLPSANATNSAKVQQPTTTTTPGAVPVSPQQQQQSTDNNVGTHVTKRNVQDDQRQLKQQLKSAMMNNLKDNTSTSSSGSTQEISAEIQPLPTPPALSSQDTIRGLVSRVGAHSIQQQQQQRQPQTRQRIDSNNNSSRNLSYTSGGRNSNNNHNDEVCPSAADMMSPQSLQAELAPDIDQIVAQALQNREQEITQGLVTADVLMPLLPQKSDSKLPVFSLEVEKRFQVEHATFTKHMIRLLVTPGIGSFLYYILWDYFQDGNLLVPLALRVGWSVYAVGTISLTYTRHFFTNYAQPITLSIFVTVNTAGSIILWYFPNGFVVGIAGLCLSVMVASMGMMQQRAATIFYLYTLLLTNLLLAYSENDSSFSLGYVFFNTNFFLIPFCSWGFIINYLVELHLRQRFRDTGTIFQWATTTTSTSNNRDHR